jgi:hypothetical protein
VHLGHIIFLPTLFNPFYYLHLTQRVLSSHAVVRWVNRPSCASFETTDYQCENEEESNVKGVWFHLRHNPGTAVAQWLRFCATNRKVAGSIPDGVIGFFR